MQLASRDAGPAGGDRGRDRLPRRRRAPRPPRRWARRRRTCASCRRTRACCSSRGNRSNTIGSPARSGPVPCSCGSAPCGPPAAIGVTGSRPRSTQCSWMIERSRSDVSAAPVEHQRAVAGDIAPAQRGAHELHRDPRSRAAPPAAARRRRPTSRAGGWRSSPRRRGGRRCRWPAGGRPRRAGTSTAPAPYRRPARRTRVQRPRQPQLALATAGRALLGHDLLQRPHLGGGAGRAWRARRRSR